MLSKSLFLIKNIPSASLNVMRLSQLMRFSTRINSNETASGGNTRSRFSEIRQEQGDRTRRVRENDESSDDYGKFRKRPVNRKKPLDSKMEQMEKKIQRVENTRMN